MDKKKCDTIVVPRFKRENGFVTSAKRSALMAKIHGNDTKSEKALRRALWGLGIRYRKNDSRLPGKPDIVISRLKVAIFIDGEFWHGYNWAEKRHRINSNREFWIPKIERNIQRDEYNNNLLAQSGWIVLRFWDQQVKREFGVCLGRILSAIAAATENSIYKENP